MKKLIKSMGANKTEGLLAEQARHQEDSVM